MKYIKVSLTEEVYKQLQVEASQKGSSVAAVASTKISLYPKQLTGVK